VHSTLQLRYRDHREKHRIGEIVQEWRVYTNRGRQITITNYTANELRPSNPRPNYLWAAIEAARLRWSDKKDDLHKERWDNLDLDRGEVWEIKPIRSIGLGVAQESYYRFSWMKAGTFQEGSSDREAIFRSKVSMADSQSTLEKGWPFRSTSPS
jgi:hypothetical protein